jgi:hypothetical protein
MKISEYVRAGISVVALVGVIGLSMASTLGLSPVGVESQSQVAGVNDAQTMQTYIRDLNLDQQNFSSLLVQDEVSASYRLMNYQELAAGTVVKFISVTNPTGSAINLNLQFLGSLNWALVTSSAILNPQESLKVEIPANTTLSFELKAQTPIATNQIVEIVITEE